MNAGPDVERLIAGWLIEEAPWRAPDRILEEAGTVIDRTRQRRVIAAWREPMYVTMRGLLAAGVAVVLIGGAVFLLGRPAGTGSTTPTPTPNPPVSAAPTTIPAPIPPGTYAADITVEAVLTALAADGTLTGAEKTSIIDDVLGIRGATTLNVEITVGETTFTVGYGTDSNPIATGAPWTMYVLDPSTIAVDIGTASSGIQAYRVTTSGESFTLSASSPAGAVETFVRRVLFETAPFEPA